MCRPSINCQKIFMDFPISRLANEKLLKWKQKVIQSDDTKSHINNSKLTDYRLKAALLLRRSILYRSTRNKMATRIPTTFYKEKGVPRACCSLFIRHHLHRKIWNTYIYPEINNDSFFYAIYIDDIFLIHTDRGTKLNFLTNFNIIHDSIKFDYEK